MNSPESGISENNKAISFQSPYGDNIIILTILHPKVVLKFSFHVYKKNYIARDLFVSSVPLQSHTDSDRWFDNVQRHLFANI